MKDQRLVNTFLTGGAEEDELPRVRNLFLYVPAFSGTGRYSLNNAYKVKALKHGIKSLCGNKLANVVLGLFSPSRFGITEYFGYDITILKDHIRFLEVIANRDGEMGGLLPLWFDGAVCDFKELPKPDDKAKMAKVYAECKKLDAMKASGNNSQSTQATSVPVMLLSATRSIKHFININFKR